MRLMVQKWGHQLQKWQNGLANGCDGSNNTLIGGTTDIQLEIWYFLLILLENNEI